MTALQPPKLLLASPVLHKSWSFCPRPQVLLGFHPYSTHCPAVGSGASCAPSVTCCALGAVGTKEVRDPCLKRVCVLIASCLLHFVPCFLKAVVALRGSRGAALFSAGLVGSPRGVAAGPKAEGFAPGPRSIPGRGRFASRQSGSPLSRLGGSSSSPAVRPQLLRGKPVSQECVRMPSSVRAHGLSSLKRSPARPQGRKQNILGRAQEVLENSLCFWRSFKQ